MALGREQLYATLTAQMMQALAYPAGPFNYIGRRPVPIGRLAAEQYPSLVFVEFQEDYSRAVLYAPARVTITLQAIIQNDEGAIADEGNVSTLNNLADAVEDALQGFCGPTAQNTLNQLVQQAWISGRQVAITGSWPQRWSEQTLSINLVLPHSR